MRPAVFHFPRLLTTAHWVLALLLFPALGHAQFATPPRPQEDYLNAAGFGLSYGVANQRDASFWGWSVEFSRKLSGPWIGAVAVMWDREREKKPGAPDAEVDSFTASATITYSITDRVSLTTGLGKGFADTNNRSQSMKFTNGDLTTGIVIGYSTPGFQQSGRDSIGYSIAYEYNLNQNETSVSFDVAFGWSF
jgi:hypothetical protein